MVTRQRIVELILPTLEGNDIEVLDIRLHGRSGRLRIALTLDHRKRGITLDECAQWSRRFEEVFDMAPDIPRKYALDVSSPGIEWPLAHEWQFRKNIGRTLLVKVRTEGGDVADTETLKVRLSGVDRKQLLIEDDQPIEIRSIIEARVALPW